MLAILEPVRLTSLWHREPKSEEKRREQEALLASIEVLTHALDALRLLSQGWTRQTMTCEIDTYEPAVVRHRLRHFSELISAANGMGASGAEAIGTSGEVDSRRTLMAIKADIEQGTDHGLYTILNWRAAERIYRRQGRQARYDQRYATFMATFRDELTPEPSQPLAEAVCIERIARCLGWYPHECQPKP